MLPNSKLPTPASTECPRCEAAKSPSYQRNSTRMSECGRMEVKKGELVALFSTASNSGEDSSDPCDDLNDAERSSDSTVRPRAGGVWAADEHERFLRGMQRFPMGPWSAIAAVVGTRSVRQVHSHAQKYAAKVERHKRGQVKIKRSKIGGGEGTSSGHRVVPKIPGKFHCQLGVLADEIDEASLADEDERNERRLPSSISISDHLVANGGYNPARHEEHWTWTERTPPSREPKFIPDHQSRYHTQKSPLNRAAVRAPKCTDSIVQQRYSNQGSGGVPVQPLPSFEESLDFLIVALDETHRG